MKRPLVVAAVAAAALLAATAAEAGRVDWSIGINLPQVSTYVSNGPAYDPAPIYAPRAYYAPPRVYVEPAYAPIYDSRYEPEVVYREPRRAYYSPAPYYAPRPSHVWLPPLPPLPAPPWAHRGWGHDDRHEDRRDDRRHDDRHDGRVDYRR